MTDARDPGWRPAVSLVPRVLIGRSSSAASTLSMMRAMVLLLGGVAAVAGVVALMFGAGAAEPRIDTTTARIGISLAMGGSVIGISMIGRSGPDVTSEGHLAVWLFQTTMRRVLSAAALGPVGLLLSWLSGDATYVVFGTGLALLLMAVGGPTKKRLAQYQREVVEAGSELSVVRALLRAYT